MDDLQVRRGSHSPRDQTSLSHHQTGHISEDANAESSDKNTGPSGKLRRTFSEIGLTGSNILGQRLSIFWEGTDLGDVWYDGRVVEYNHAKKEYLVEYDDGDTDWYDLDKVKYTILPPESSRSNVDDELVTKEDEGGDSSAATTGRQTFSSLGLSGVSILGRTLEVYWSDPDSGDAWYKGVLKEYRISDGKHFIAFEDGDSDWYDLEDIKYRLPATDGAAEVGGAAGACVGSESDLHHDHHTAHGHTSTWTKEDVAEQKRTINEQGLSGEEAMGATVEIFWQDDEADGGGMWYAGNIDEYNGKLHHVTYEDGDSDWYDLSSIKHHVLEMPLSKRSSKKSKGGEEDKTKKNKSKKRKSKKMEVKFSSSQPDDSRRRSQEWLDDLKKRRAEKKRKNQKDGGGTLGYEVVGELSVGGVVALRTVHEAMLKERYFLKSAQERLDEYWQIQLRSRFGKNNHPESKSGFIQTLRTELSSTGYLLPPVKDSSSSTGLHDRFHEITRAHGDLHVAGLPGQVHSDDDDELDDGGHHTSQVLGLQSEARRAGLSSSMGGPKTIVVKEDKSSTKEEQEKMESDLLAGATVPPPPAPQVQVTLDTLLESMKVGELGEGEKHPEDYVHEFLEAGECYEMIALTTIKYSYCQSYT